MLTINDDVATRLQKRLDQLWKLFGVEGTKIENLEAFANKLISDYLDKKDKEALTSVNAGVTWKQFRNNNFRAVWKRDGGRCKYCTRRVTSNKATLDHILSPLRGGQNTLENVTIACYWCNQDKGILTDEEYFYKQLVNASKGIKPQ